MGQAIGDMSRSPGRESFNCNYDLSACQTAMTQLSTIRTYFVDIPRFDDCHDTVTPPAHCYNPNMEMVAGSNARGTGGLLRQGLPGRLRRALLNDVQCISFYTTPGTVGKPCNSRSTWEPASVAAGPGGEMLLWDQTAALFLLNPRAFRLYYPPSNPSIGGQHYEPRLIRRSDALTIRDLRRQWTRYTNRASYVR